MSFIWFFAILVVKVSKFHFWANGWVLAIKCKHFRDFLQISALPKITSLKLFENSWCNTDIQFLVIIIEFHFIWGEEKLCQIVKNATNVLLKIAWKFCFALQLRKWSIFSTLKYIIFINTDLLQLELRLVDGIMLRYFLQLSCLKKQLE